MKIHLLLSRPCWSSPLVAFSPSSFSSYPSSPSAVCRLRFSIRASSSPDATNVEQLSARERRQLRNERRELKAYDWKDEVEERLARRRKKKPPSARMEELNLDNLARLGPQWWVIRVSRLSGQEAAEQLARGIARNFPNIDFKVYVPAVHIKNKLKNGTYSIKEKSLFPGCIFLHCILNKELHDFIREWSGIGGFLGSKVGNSKRQINRPKPVAAEEIEAIFQQAKEEQEKIDRAFLEENHLEGIMDDGESNQIPVDGKRRGRSKKVSKPSVLRKQEEQETANGSMLVQEETKVPVLGSSVKVTSSPFMEFTGSLKEFNVKTGKATVAFMFFGKETLVDVNVDEIVM
ncbi:uncharacterized protein LOC116254909 [Nymphaea colorata]|nr:uncharacterized protein LOC116254909 [Nymphaea colorata]XP_031486418.1 uncharacterized protein LOC116254909 [Nymphaea colorata]XP_049934089.1 uncharacterized protein LOC116254909 [Nymphaea colorata]